MKSMPEEKQKSWFKRHWFLTGILGFFLLFVVIGMLQGIGKGITGDAINEGTQKESLPGSYEEAAQKAVKVSYEDLMRYSESYEGKWVCFEGQIGQVITDVPDIELLVATKKDEWVGYIEDIIYLYSDDFSGERLLEEDIIQFCGKSTGTITYEAIFGNQVSVPEIETYDLYVKRID